MPLDCTTTFASNGAVQHFGGAARGSLKADGDDLAGQGIVVAFFLPSAINLVLSTFLILSRAGGKWKKK
ncbi:MAG: hypothetical protein LQ337_005605 [Flavoplaca oasis]|nr:MAG: hypothetical protein LQ337_005605 [Flavoplaca oasis]